MQARGTDYAPADPKVMQFRSLREVKKENLGELVKFLISSLAIYKINILGISIYFNSLMVGHLLTAAANAFFYSAVKNFCYIILI